MERVTIIAEVGVNHNGSMELAEIMIDKAAEAGVDIVKFQAGPPERLITKNAPKAVYQAKNTGNSQETMLEMIKKIEIPLDSNAVWKRHVEARGMEYLVAPFERQCVRYLNGLGVKRWKIPSPEVNDPPCLVEVAKTHKPVLLSTGMCSLNEIRTAIKILQENGSGEITLLQCNTEYPTPFSDVNLRAMVAMKEEFGLPVGYSDHTLGYEAAVAAVALGATVIEKHFTICRELPGPDHRASLLPEELKAMVQAIRNVELALGSEKKEPSQSEIKNRPIQRKSIVARCHINKGEIFTEENLTTKRPGTGISSAKWFEVLGETADRDYEEDDLIVEN